MAALLVLVWLEKLAFGCAMCEKIMNKTITRPKSKPHVQSKVRRSTHVVASGFAMLCMIGGPDAQAAKTPDWLKQLEKGYYEMSIGNLDKAKSIFASKVKKYPNSGACHTALGQVYKKYGKQQEAKQQFREATEVEPTFADGFYELGVMQESDKEWPQAASSFERYLALKPEAAKRQAVADRIRFCKEHVLPY